MIPRNFDYHAPRTVGEAIALLGQYGSEAKLLAGGHSLLPMMKLRFAEPGHMIDLNRIPELKGIQQVDNEIRIGAMATENELIWSELLQQKVPLLVEAARLIGDPQVRYRGTIGGDISHGDPGNDHPALMLTLGASFVLKGAAGERVVPADSYFLGTYYTAINPDEIMTQIRIPIPPAESGYCYAKLKRKTGDFATAAAAVLLTMKDGVCGSISIALTNVGQTPLQAKDAETSLKGQPLTEAAIDAAAQKVMAICEPAADLRGDEAYKTAMAGQMFRKAIRTAITRCTP
ncbi:MAG: FAD binding domain-containing protein [Polaromonas sp.]